MTKPIRVFIADDNRLLREGLASMLEQEPDINVVGSAESGDKAYEGIKQLIPDIALIDLGMPDKDGIEITQALHDEISNVKVVILGMLDLTNEIMACIEAGAAGYILKEASYEYLLETIRSVHLGKTFCSPEMTASLFTRIAELAGERLPKTSQNTTNLTNRELEVINLIAEGLSNKEIAQKLYIATQTVKNHVHNILEKLQLHTRLEAVQYADERNLLTSKRR